MYKKDDVAIILAAEQIIVLFISAITLVFRESILSFSYIGKIRSTLEKSEKTNDFYNHSKVQALSYNDVLKSSSFVDLMSETQSDLLIYEKKVERYKRFFNRFYLLMMLIVLLTTGLFSLNIFHPDNLFVKVMYVFQYGAVILWSISVLQIENQKNKILASFNNDNILHQYINKMHQVNDQAIGLSDEISLLNKNFTKVNS